MRHGEQQGFVKIIIAIVVAIFVLAYFGFDIKGWLDSPEIKEFFFTLWDTIKFVTTDYIVAPLLKLWELLGAWIDSF